MSEKVITLPWPDKALQSNTWGNKYVKARKVKEARNHAWAVAMEAPRVEKIPDAVIVIEYHPKSYRGDPHNVPGALKAYLDGIADAMGCSDKEWAVHWPTKFSERRDPPEVVFRVMRPQEQGK